MVWLFKGIATHCRGLVALASVLLRQRCAAAASDEREERGRGRRAPLYTAQRARGPAAACRGGCTERVAIVADDPALPPSAASPPSRLLLLLLRLRCTARLLSAATSSLF